MKKFFEDETFENLVENWDDDPKSKRNIIVEENNTEN